MHRPLMHRPRMHRSHTPGAVPPLSSRRSVLALGFFGLVVVLLVWVVVPSPGHDPAGTGHHGAGSHGAVGHGAGSHGAVGHGTRSRASTAPGAVSPRTPGTLGGEAELSAAPTDVTWELFDSVALPYARAAGPGTVEADGAVAGFAHDPEGALVALVQIAVRHLLASDWQAVTQADVAPGPGRTAYIALRNKIERSGQMPAVPGHYMEVAGFSFVGYSSASASINIVSRSTSGALQVVTETVVWERDWKLELTSSGSAAPGAVAVGSLAGYVAWSGVS